MNGNLGGANYPNSDRYSEELNELIRRQYKEARFRLCVWLN